MLCKRGGLDSTHICGVNGLDDSLGLGLILGIEFALATRGLDGDEDAVCLDRLREHLDALCEVWMVVCLRGRRAQYEMTRVIDPGSL